MSKNKPCPNEADHVDGPEGYIAWHEWAEDMMKTHRQKRCRGCSLWKIWVPKENKQ